MERTYKVKQEDKKEPLNTVIEIGGITDEIAVRQVTDNIQALEQQIHEVETKMRLEKATMENCMNNHPAIKDLLPADQDSDEDKEKKEIFTMIGEPNCRCSVRLVIE